MNRIRRPDYIWKFKCGEYDHLADRVRLCETCAKIKPEERPKDCKNVVKVDYGPKY